MRLSQFLRANFVLSHLEARDVEGVIAEVSACAGRAEVAPGDIIAQRLLEREKLHTTVMGSGLAIPHATVPGLTEPVIGVALARDPIAFGPEGADPVRVFVVLLSPPGRESDHVKLLARICRIMRHDHFVDQLELAEDASGIVHFIEAIDSRHA